STCNTSSDWCSMACAIVWPCAAPTASVLRINKSKVPWSSSPCIGAFPRFGIAPQDNLPERPLSIPERQLLAHPFKIDNQPSSHTSYSDSYQIKQENERRGEHKVHSPSPFFCLSLCHARSVTVKGAALESGCR